MQAVIQVPFVYASLGQVMQIQPNVVYGLVLSGVAWLSTAPERIEILGAHFFASGWIQTGASCLLKGSEHDVRSQWEVKDPSISKTEPSMLQKKQFPTSLYLIVLNCSTISTVR